MRNIERAACAVRVPYERAEIKPVELQPIDEQNIELCKRSRYCFEFGKLGFCKIARMRRIFRYAEMPCVAARSAAYCDRYVFMSEQSFDMNEFAVFVGVYARFERIRTFYVFYTGNHGKTAFAVYRAVGAVKRLL